MTLPNILKLTEDIKACFEATMKGERGLLKLADGSTMQYDGALIVADHKDLKRELVVQTKVMWMLQMARERLGPPGGPAPVEGGSFDWEVKPTVSGDVHFIIKSYTDQRTLDRLRAQYAQFGGGIMHDNSYDFR